MRIRRILVLGLMISTLVVADDSEKAQKKEMQAQAKAAMKDGAALEKSGKLAEAREKYTESQSLYESGDATDAIKHVDETIRNRAKENLSSARKLYEQHKFKEAATILEDTMNLGVNQSVVAYDLALCYDQLGDREQAAEYLRKARAGTRDPKQKQRLLQLLAFVTTGENGSPVGENDHARIDRLNHLSESIGMEASLADDGGEEDDPPAEADDAADPVTKPAPAATLAKTGGHAGTNTETNKGPRASLCNALGEFKTASAKSPSLSFNLANCAETNGRTNEAAKFLEKYLEVAPTALDVGDVHARIADLEALMALPGKNGAEIRRLYAAAYAGLSERQYDRALEAFRKAADLAPDFALTKWKLGLLYEAEGDIDGARKKYAEYQQLTTDPAALDEAALHLKTLDAKRSKYDEEVDEAEDILADLFNRGMNLTFNGPENRRSLRAKRAQAKKKERKVAKGRVGGFAVPYAYAQQQLKYASEHLQVALALFPLGAEANELIGLVFLQANDGHAALKSFDVVISQGLPVSFYAEMRGHKLDHAVKCELTRDHLRFIFLSTYDKKGTTAPPSKRPGEDGLGDMTIAPGDERQASFDSLEITPAEIKKVETSNGLLRLKLEKQEFSLAPIFLPAFTPIQGPPARRFANNYTRLFVRYPGLEDSKLGNEGMTGGEKFAMGVNIATSGIDIAAGGFTLIGAIASVQDTISIARTIHSAVSSLGVSFASWEKSVDDQQRLLAGKSFKPVPVQPVSLVFAQEFK